MTVNLTTACRVTSGPGRQFLASLKPGDPVGLHYELNDCEVVSNGIVAYVEDGNVVADFPRSQGPGRKFLDRPKEPYGITSAGRAPARQHLSVGSTVKVVERYPDGRQALITGVVRVVEDIRYQVGGIWFHYRPTGVKTRIIGGK